MTNYTDRQLLTFYYVTPIPGVATCMNDVYPTVSQPLQTSVLPMMAAIVVSSFEAAAKDRELPPGICKTVGER